MAAYAGLDPQGKKSVVNSHTVENQKSIRVNTRMGLRSGLLRKQSPYLGLYRYRRYGLAVEQNEIRPRLKGFFYFRACEKFCYKFRASRALKICVLRWDPAFIGGALWIENLARRAREFIKILSPRGGFLRRFFAAKKAAFL